MSITEALIAFALTAGLVTLTPGLDTALVLRTAAVERGGRAFMAGLGISVGCLTWGIAAALGLGALSRRPLSLFTASACIVKGCGFSGKSSLPGRGVFIW